ncbi:DUF92 domain-containing protein [Heliophilum fasciatum]|uniref:Uncharacterized protein (TIGR00297 family) n=1 Tax=Heliophilum fasciatum TaxID=35700 RepID=A0A4R2S0G2_9FIRM|nr:DUF92 domain-containing protein [Heliophilum fasciatum]MCW2276872.1 uncharacterized protein (TIGR00297 family) [Heliophilum fasciatum]TCP68667.1 uncharacterized protein (TIGR00297 family) [Heliophilum fasciatum]
MTQSDLFGLIASYGYVLGLLIVATLVQKWRGYPPEFTRKIVHIGAGMWIVGAVAIFDHWTYGVIPISSFIVLNYISYRFRLNKAVDLAGDTLGTVYFAASVTLLLLIFWPRGEVEVAVAATMIMTWGDAFAAIIGQAMGKHVYMIGGHRRTYEGSLAMAVVSFLVIAVTLAWLRPDLGVLPIIMVSLVLAVIATVLEAVSLKGLDNVAVPLGTGGLLWLMLHDRFPVSMVLTGLVLSSLIGWLAYRRRSLAESGVAGAILVGTLIFGFGGWIWGLTLVAFFVYSSALSKYKEAQKNVVAEEKFDKGSRRDFGQALANGGFGGVLALLHYYFPGEPALFAAFIGCMATVNADTWATEIGVLSKSRPRLITTGKPVVPGTSGGITPLGTTATLLGGLLIGVTVWVFVGVAGMLGGTAGVNAAGVEALGVSAFGVNAAGVNVPGVNAPGVPLAGFVDGWWIILAGMIGGLGGSLADSLMGATVQVMYVNAETGKETEKKRTKSGVPNRYSRGWRWMDNDLVNFISSAMGAGVAVVVAAWFT